MRPVDQVVADLRKAEELAKQTNVQVQKYKAELEQIHAAVREALDLRV